MLQVNKLMQIWKNSLCKQLTKINSNQLTIETLLLEMGHINQIFDILCKQNREKQQEKNRVLKSE